MNTDETGRKFARLLDNTVGSIKQQPSTELEVPQKVTIPWLLKHVPVQLWITAVGIAGSLLIAVFVLGVKSSEISIVRELFGLQNANSIPTSNAPAKPIKP